MPAVHRILDANANRAREALRVMEDAARFILDDAALCADLKQLRHDLAAALTSLPPGLIEAHRDTPADVGTSITTEREQSRADVAAVAVAAGKRLSEALRTIEEYAKLLPQPAGSLAPAMERLRYRGYDLEQRLQRVLGATAVRQWRLCVLLSENLCPRGDWQTVARAVVDAGGDCLQLREKALDAGPLLQRARWLVELCRPRGVCVVINDRPDVALLAGADGVHLGQGDLPCRDARKLAGRQLLVGVSTANLKEARQAVADGADYYGVGPMFPTTTKKKNVLAGPAYLADFIRAFPNVPHLAIGGVTVANIDQLLAVGMRGVAVSSAVCGADDPAATVRVLLSKLPKSM